MAKTFVLDTNVLVHDPGAIFSFRDNEVVIPIAVIEELDGLKSRQDDEGRNAREASRIIDGLREKGGLAEGVELENGGTLRIEVNHQDILSCRIKLDPNKADNRILAVAIGLKAECAGYGRWKKTNTGDRKEDVILVSKDLNVRIKADVAGVRAEDYTTDKVDYSSLYRGVRELTVGKEDLSRLFAEKKLEPPGGLAGRLFPHEFAILKDEGGSSGSALVRYSGGLFLPLRHHESRYCNIRARNKEQKFALELLADDAVKVVSLIGPAGTGKTLLALAVGLEKVLGNGADAGGFKRLLVMRPIMPMGKDLGYMPGTKEEKLRPWMQPIYDNFEFIMRQWESRGKNKIDDIDMLMRMGVLEMGALTFVRGRSIPNQFIICDEAQNLTPKQIKTLVTRVGEGSKIVFTGDPDQIDHPYVDSSSNGLSYLAEKLKEEKISGHITLVKSERSEVAEVGAKRL